jgi:hypothetical protein
MQPQTTPSSPNPQYDFIFNSGQPAPKHSKLPLPNLPKPILLLLSALVLLILVIIVGMILSSAGKADTKPYVDLMSRSAEIVRVSELAKKDLHDSDALALLTTTTTALGSEQTQLGLYLAGLGTETKPELLTSYLNTETDAGIESAVKNNTLEKTYSAYLKGSLDGYLSALRNVQPSADSKAKPIITEAIASTEFLLKSPQLASQ